MALDLFETFATDETKEIEGVEVPLGKGAFITVARQGNPEYSRLILAEYEKHSDELDTLSPKEVAALDAEIMSRVMSESILLGFRGLTFQGKEVKYSKKAAYEKLLELKDFRARVERESKKVDHFRATYDKAAVKN
jgi:hypothetical protein